MLTEEVVCAENFDWCTVPNVGYDVIFVPGIAVILACLIQNRYSTTLVLIIGALDLCLLTPGAD